MNTATSGWQVIEGSKLSTVYLDGSIAERWTLSFHVVVLGCNAVKTSSVDVNF
jgi:hypothetical protein